MGDGCVPLSMILGYILIDIDIEWDGGGGGGSALQRMYVMIIS